jgi:hypothetical protein
MSTVSAVLVTAAALAAAAPAGAAPAARDRLTDVRVTDHFDLLAGQMPENIALLPDGTADVTFAAAGQVARITRGGATRILATLPVPGDA